MLGIFISHIGEDKVFARALKDELKALFEGVEVFVSSDYESIASGEDWHGVILDSLKKSEIVIVLCHTTSILRPWINYEAGVGDGCGTMVLPLAIRRFAKGDLKQPLARKQIRDTSDPQDVNALLRDVGIVTEKADERHTRGLRRAFAP